MIETTIITVLKKIVPIFIFLLFYAAYIFTCSLFTTNIIDRLGGSKRYDENS